MQVIVTPVILHFGGKEVLGTYSFLMQIYTWVIIVDMGFGVGIERQLAQAHGLQDGHVQFRKVFAIGRTYYVFVNIVIALIIFIISINIESMIKMQVELQDSARISLIALSIYLAVRTPITMFGNALTTTQCLAPANIIFIIGNALRFGFAISFSILGFGLFGLMMAYILSDFLTAIMQRFYYKMRFPSDRMGWGVSDKNLFKSIFSFGSTYMLLIITSKLNTSTDSLIVGFTLGASAVAVYYTSQMPGALLYQFIWKITDSSWPALNDLFANNEFDRIKSAYIKVFKYSIVFGFGLFMGLLLYNRDVIYVWVGKEQYAGDMFTLFLALYALIQIVTHLNTSILAIYNRIKIMGFIGLVSGIIKIGTAFFLLKWIGLAGLMLTYVVLDLPGLIYCMIQSTLILKLEFKPFFMKAILPSVFSILPAAGFMIIIFFLPHADDILSWHLAVSVCSFILTWGAGAYIFSIEKEEKKKLIEKFLARWRQLLNKKINR